MVLIKGKEYNISSHPHGQHYSPVIFNENGVYQKPGVDCDQQRNLAIPFEMKDDDYCRILTRVNECRFRQGIQANQGFQRMETKLSNLYEIVSDKENTKDGCLPRGCHTNHPSTCHGKSTLQVRAGMLFRYPGLTICVRFPAFCTHRKGSSESKSGSASSAHNNPSLDMPT